MPLQFPSSFSFKTPSDYHSSFSGQDYKILVHLPVLSPGNWASHFQIRELNDEIAELQYQLNQLNVTEKPASVSKSEAVASAETRRVALQQAINELTTQKNALSTTKKEQSLLILDSVQTISFQIHRGKKPVRSLGAIYPKEYTCGSRVICGSIIFTVFEEHPMAELIDTMNTLNPEIQRGGILPAVGSSVNASDLFLPASALLDELPPVDISLLAVNEQGSASNTFLYGVRFLNEGQVQSVQDILTELTVNFVAQDIDMMRTLDTRGSLRIKAVNRKVTVSDLMTTRAFMSRKVRRNYPF